MEQRKLINKTMVCSNQYYTICSADRFYYRDFGNGVTGDVNDAHRFHGKDIIAKAGKAGWILSSLASITKVKAP